MTKTPYRVGDVVKVRGYRGSVKLLRRLETPSGSGWQGMWVGHHLVAVRDETLGSVVSSTV